MSNLVEKFEIINPRPEHFDAIQALCRKVYPFTKPWSIEQLESHQQVFPDGQLIVIEKKTGNLVGLAFSLIILWDDYSAHSSWQEFTSKGLFDNHDPKNGKTLYGAEVMVDADYRSKGLGKLLYKGRQDIVKKYGLKRIRAGARLRGYGTYKEELTPKEYVNKVINKEIFDPTLSFQLKQGFVVLEVISNYLLNDPESLGFAAIIEWLNPEIASPEELEKSNNSFK